MGRNWRMRELRNPDTIRNYLNTDRLYAAYALGDLESALFPHCRWWLAEPVAAEGDQDWALVLHFDGLTPSVAVCLGEPMGVAVLLAQAPLPDRIYLICRLDHLRPAMRILDLPSPRLMARMVLEQSRFCPVPRHGVVRQGPENLSSLEALYATGAGAGDAFAAYQLANGVYYGICLDGRLVSVAGTHLVAPNEGFGAVGNVFTHPSYRRNGYAAACTSAVCADLLAQDLVIVLNVSTDNIPALRLYERLGFREHCTYYEGTGTKIN
jgi:ribosomal protein S18 acetylase RimI-like enzyme